MVAAVCQHIRRSEMASTACQRNANQKVNENLYLSDNKKEDSFLTKLTTPCVDYTQTLYAQTQKAILVYAVVKSGYKFFQQALTTGRSADQNQTNLTRLDTQLRNVYSHICCFPHFFAFSSITVITPCFFTLTA